MRRRFKQLEDGRVILEEGCVVLTSSKPVDELDLKQLSDEELEELRKEPSAFAIARDTQQRVTGLTRGKLHVKARNVYRAEASDLQSK